MTQQNPGNLPTEPPAIGGWFWNEKTQQKNFQMPPFPGVDDCVRLPDGRYAYRRFYERDRRAEARQVAPLEFIPTPYTLAIQQRHFNRVCLIDWRSQRYGHDQDHLRRKHARLRGKLANYHAKG